MTTCLKGTSRPSFEQIRLCSMRAPSETCTSWKLTLLDSVAEYSFTGTCASPKLIVPFQIDLGGYSLPAARATQP